MAGESFVVGTVADLTAGEIEKKQAEHKVQSREADQRENRVAIAHDFAVPVARVKKAIDQPWLSAQFGRYPAQRVSDVGKKTLSSIPKLTMWSIPAGRANSGNWHSP